MALKTIDNKTLLFNNFVVKQFLQRTFVTIWIVTNFITLVSSARRECENTGKSPLIYHVSIVSIGYRYIYQILLQLLN